MVGPFGKNLARTFSCTSDRSGLPFRGTDFLLRVKAVAVFPGGFGTLDEFMELLTLIQTGKMRPIPILLFGKEFWNRVINFEDLGLFQWVETAEEAWAKVVEFYELT